MALQHLLIKLHDNTVDFKASVECINNVNQAVVDPRTIKLDSLKISYCNCLTHCIYAEHVHLVAYGGFIHFA